MSGKSKELLTNYWVSKTKVKLRDLILSHLPCTSIELIEETNTGYKFRCGQRQPFLLFDRYNKLIAILPYPVERYEGTKIKYEKCTPLTNFQKIANIKGGFVCSDFVGIIRKDGKTFYYKRKA